MIKILRPRSAILSVLLVNGMASCASSGPEQNSRSEDGSRAESKTLELSAPPKKPNILMIVADDLGYSDLGALGGEISTPNLDALVAEGRLLTNHHVSTVSAPMRAMLMSGTDHHLVGLGQMQLPLFPALQGLPGYEGYLNDRSLSVAELLHDAETEFGRYSKD